MDALPRLPDDGLLTPVVKPWAERKYQLLRGYAEVFATSMKKKWSCRVYLDLFAGAGRSTIEDTDQIVPSSSMLALGIHDPFDRYVLCDQDGRKLEALRERVARDYPEAVVRFVQGDVNDLVDQVFDEVPAHGTSFKVLTFCFVDPYACSNLRFATIETLSQKFMDFLVLIPSGMDAQRNERLYQDASNHTLDLFLGNANWRKERQSAKNQTRRFADFVTDQFGLAMRRLGYRYDGLGSRAVVRSTDKHLHLYDLVLFSRHELGERFWRDVRRYAEPQGRLF